MITRPSGKTELKLLRHPWLSKIITSYYQYYYFHYYFVIVVSSYSLNSFHDLNGEEVIVSGVVGRIFQGPTKDLDNELDVETRRIEINIFLFSHNVGQNEERLCKGITGKGYKTNGLKLLNCLFFLLLKIRTFGLPQTFELLNYWTFNFSIRWVLVFYRCSATSDLILLIIRWWCGS